MEDNSQPLHFFWEKNNILGFRLEYIYFEKWKYLRWDTVSFWAFEIRLFQLKSAKIFSKVVLYKNKYFFSLYLFSLGKKVINNISLHLTKSKMFCNLKGKKNLSYRLIWIYQTALLFLFMNFLKEKYICNKMIYGLGRI